MSDAEKLVKLDKLISIENSLEYKLKLSSTQSKEKIEDKLEEVKILINECKKDIVADSSFWTMAGLDFRNYCEHYKWG